MMKQIAEDYLRKGIAVCAGVLELFAFYEEGMRAREDLNPRPFDPKSNALSS